VPWTSLLVLGRLECFPFEGLSLLYLAPRGALNLLFFSSSPFAYINLVILLFKEPEGMRMSLYCESSSKTEDSESIVLTEEKTIAIIRISETISVLILFIEASDPFSCFFDSPRR
jgi:hypothetical protein